MSRWSASSARTWSLALAPPCEFLGHLQRDRRRRGWSRRCGRRRGPGPRSGRPPRPPARASACTTRSRRSRWPPARRARSRPCWSPAWPAGSCAGAPAVARSSASRSGGGTGSRRCSSPSAPPPPSRPRRPPRRPRCARPRSPPPAARALRAATADATATPQRCSGVSAAAARSTDCRFSLMSRAGSANLGARSSAATASCRHAHAALQGRFALLPVARAELVGLQRVEHAQHLVDVAADVQVVDARRSG